MKRANPLGNIIQMMKSPLVIGFLGVIFMMQLAVQVAFALGEALAGHREQGGWQARRHLYRLRAARIHAELSRLGVTTHTRSSR